MISYSPWPPSKEEALTLFEQGQPRYSHPLRPLDGYFHVLRIFRRGLWRCDVGGERGLGTIHVHHGLCDGWVRLCGRNADRARVRARWI